MNSDISLKALRYFVVAIREGSITEAAKVVNVVPSAVHTAINQVEAAFGLQLTIRSRSKGNSLTATGHQMIPKIQNLLDEYESLLQDGGDMRTRLTGTLRIGYYAPAAPAFMPEIVEQILQGNHEVSVKFFECDNQSAQDGLVSGAYDVIVCFAKAMKTGIAYETLLEVPGYALVPASHPFAGRPSISMQDFAGQNIVLLDLPVVSEYYASQFDQAGIKPRIVATANSLEMVRSLVGNGIGCSLLHMLTANDVTYAGDKVAAVPLQPPVDPLKIVLGHLPDNPRRLVKMFVTELQTYFQKPEARALRVARPKS
ncbi:LysR family transcriptional regulator [uncultured Roseobacter sp.]|uniref:LysR family transcriptional regulator n=1 Tax=uncultured Roseobacter sp. TaxID=114847 RepID=UPI0026077157|nr:LysR family transcriptional regulator [uncultured Roseobacter sp.]